jgi:hypothetical protein
MDFFVNKLIRQSNLPAKWGPQKMRGGLEAGRGIFWGRGPKVNVCRRSLRNEVKKDSQAEVRFWDGAGRGSRTLILGLENRYNNRYTIPARQLILMNIFVVFKLFKKNQINKYILLWQK